MTTEQTITQLFEAMTWIQEVSKSDDQHIIDMLDGIQSAINTLDELRIDGTIE